MRREEAALMTKTNAQEREASFLAWDVPEVAGLLRLAMIAYNMSE